jgi:hypothetical protein
MLQTVLSQPGVGSPIIRARALSVLGRLNWRDANHWPETRAALEESLAIYRTMGDLDGSAEVLSDLAFVVLLSGDVKHSETLEEESLREARTARNRGRAAWALQGLAWKAILQGHNARGNVLLDESQSLFENRATHSAMPSGVGCSGGQRRSEVIVHRRWR